MEQRILDHIARHGKFTSGAGAPGNRCDITVAIENLVSRGAVRVTGDETTTREVYLV